MPAAYFYIQTATRETKVYKVLAGSPEEALRLFQDPKITYLAIDCRVTEGGPQIIEVQPLK